MSRGLKIGMIVNNLAVSGGYQKLVLRLGAALGDRGHRVTTYTLAADRSRCYSGAWGSQRIVSPEGGISTEAAISPTPGLWARLAPLVERDLDALILHNEQCLHALPACGLLNGRHPRIVWMLNNELGILSQDIGDILRRLRPSIARPYRLPHEIRIAGRELRERSTLRRAVAAVDAFAVYDRANGEAVHSVLDRDATVVYAGADVEQFERLFPPAGRDPGEPLNVLSVGVLFPHRRYEDLIEAVALLRPGVDARLTIVGLHRFVPDYARGLEELVVERGLTGQVSFQEYVDTEELHDLYRTADAFAFVNDGLTWGIAVFEAIAAGLPVVITDNIGAADLVQPGRHGWVVPARQPGAIADALREIHADPVGAAEIGSRAREQILDIVRWSAYAERIEGLLEPA